MYTRLYLPAYATCCGGSGVDIFQLCMCIYIYIYMYLYLGIHLSEEPHKATGHPSGAAAASVAQRSTE